MEWTAEFINDLPDSAFAYIEPGGKKDADGKTVPRSLRHFPMRGEDGKLDEAHVQNARSRMAQSEHGEKAKPAIMAAMKALGMGEMAESVELAEAIEFTSQQVDRENFVIRGVAVLGSESRNADHKGNRRRYSPGALAEGIKFFEGAPVYLEHEKQRRARDLAGELRGLRVSEGKLKGDLHVAKAQEWLLDVAERFPKQVGLSILTQGKVRETPSGEIVEGFIEGARRSVDLVTEPATVKNLFESVKENDLEVKELLEKITALEGEIKTLKDTRTKEVEEVKAKALEEEKKQKTPHGDEYARKLEEQILGSEKQIGELSKKVTVLEEEKRTHEQRTKIEKLLKEGKKRASEAAVSAMLRITDEKEIKALVESLPDERVSLVSTSTTTGNQEKNKHLRESFCKVLGIREVKA